MTSNTASSLLTDPSAPSRTQNEELLNISRVSQTRSIGAVISAQYDIKISTLLMSSLRGDGNSRFGPSYRYGLFPGASVRWRVSEELF